MLCKDVCRMGIIYNLEIAENKYQNYQFNVIYLIYLKIAVQEEA